LAILRFDWTHQFLATVAQVLDSRQTRPYFKKVLISAENWVGSARLASSSKAQPQQSTRSSSKHKQQQQQKLNAASRIINHTCGHILDLVLTNSPEHVIQLTVHPQDLI